VQDHTHNFFPPGYDQDVPAGRPAKGKRTSFGERLTTARQQTGLTQEQLAERLGTTQRVIAYWERKPVALRPDQLAALADALGVSADFLIGRTPGKKRGAGPIGKAKRLFEQISRLPRHQQEKLFAILEPYVAQHSTGRSRAA
jgi:transcriptional regulator with XRE-family HTH domain